MSPPDSSATDSPRGSEDHRNKTSTDENAIDSLGEALAGVNMGANASQANAGAFGSSAVNVSSSPFGLSQPSAQGDDGWGNYTEAAQAAFPSSATNSLKPATSALEGSALSNTGQTRSEGFDLFLSQSPSKTLGDDVFRLSHQNLPSLANEDSPTVQSDTPSSFRYTGSASLAPGPSSTGSFGAHADLRRRTESPSCSVTGTTSSSRSVSPYTNSSGDVGNMRTIHAYQRFESNASVDVLGRNPGASFAEDERSSPGYSISQAHGSHPSLATLDSAHRSPYVKDRAGAFKNSATGSPYDQTIDRSFASPNDIVSPQQQIPAAGASQSQVLYMAVPSPDGRGQVLQPVQMLQLPGKPNYFVGSIAGQGGENGQQPMMMLPTGSQPSDFGSLANSADSLRSPLDNRSRVANYAIENGSTPSPNSLRDDLLSTGSPYQVDQAVASLYAAPQRPPLDALLGQVRRLSRDQVGCRLVQQALDEEGPMAATLILNEGLPFWGEAMVDPFGNYLFQKILEKVTLEERVMLVKSIAPRLVNASLNLHGTRSVQKVVELCSVDEQNGHMGGEETAADILTTSLAPAAARLCIDSHGNHVIQRILLKLGPKHTKFVFDAVAASVSDVARHRHGCCVIQRCLDSPPNEARAHLVNRIVEKSLELMQDAYGNYVVQYVLDVCSDEDVHAVCDSVVGKVNLLAIQKFSSNVMEKCLERCADRTKELYLQEMSDPQRIRELMMDPFGNYVVQRALSVATHAQAIRLVEAMRPHLIATQTSGPHGQRNGGVRNTAGGRRIIAKICRRFPNFTLSTVGSQDEQYNSNRSAHRQQQQQQHHLHHPHHGAVGGSYSPAVGTPTHSQQHYTIDPRLSQGHMAVQQQQSYYSVGGSPYYDQFGGHGGFNGM